MSPQRYTVLGAQGFIGGKLTAALNASGADCYTPGRNDNGVFTEDLGHVFYCIGLTADYRARPYDTVEAHVSFLSRILEKSSFDKLIYLSSTRLYDGLEGDLCREQDDLKINTANPRHLYDLSKGLGENLCLTASDGRASVARLAAVYDICPEATGFLSNMLHRLQTEREFILESSSGVTRDYVALDDVIKCLVSMLGMTSSEIVNVASGNNISNQDVIDVLNAEGFKISVRTQSEREIRPLCDISKMKELGINPVSVTTYLRNLIKSGVIHADG